MQCTHNRAREVSLQLLCSEPLADGVVIPRNGFRPIWAEGRRGVGLRALYLGAYGLPSRKPLCGQSRAASAATTSFINRVAPTASG